MSEEQERGDPVKWLNDNADIPIVSTIRKWIETYSSIENVVDISFRVEPFELLFDKDGNRPECLSRGFLAHIASPITEVTITLKDDAVHRAGYLQTGEFFKIKA